MRSGSLKSALLCLLAAVCLFACARKSSDEEMIRASLARAAASAEERDTAAIMKLVSKDYKDDSGLDYNGIKGVLFAQFLRPGKIKVFITGIKVEIKTETALVTAKTAFARGKDINSIKDLVPDNAEAALFTMIFKKQDEKWMLVNASWESISVAGLL